MTSWLTDRFRRQIFCFSYLILGLILPLVVVAQQHHPKALPTIALSGHDGWVTSIDHSPDGRFLVSGSSDKTVKVWSIEDKKEIATFIGHTQMVNAVEFAPNGELIASASSDATVRLWSLPRQQEVDTIQAHKYGINDVTFSPDGKLLATASRDYTVKLWSVETLELIAELDRQQNLMQSIEFSPDGKQLATGSDSSGLWNVEDFRQIAAWNTTEGWIWSIDFSPSGEMILTAQSSGQIRLWNTADRKEIKSLVGHQSDVSEAKFSPDGLLIASASREIRLWSVVGMTPITRLKDGENYVHTVDFAPNGLSIATGMHNRTILIWDIRPYLDPTIVQAEVVEATFEEVIVDLNVENSLDLYGFQFDLKFDPEILIAKQVQEGNFLKKAGDNTYWMPGVINNETGTIHDILSIRLVPGEVVGQGNLARLIFAPKQTLDNHIEFTRFQLSNAKSESIVTYVNGIEVKMPIRVSADIFVNAWTEGSNVLAEVQLGFPVNVHGFQVDLNYPPALELLPVSNQSLKFDLNKVRGITENTLFKFHIYQGGKLKFTLSDGLLNGPLETTALPILYSKQIEITSSPTWDINRDYTVDLFDLVILANHLGLPISGNPRPNPDVNRDGRVDLFDFVKVGANFNQTYSPNPRETVAAPTTVAKLSVDLGLVTSNLRQIAVELERHPMANRLDFSQTRQLLASLISPMETILYPNYPNPFNPETWLPFQLAQDAGVRIVIYNVEGSRVRQLDIGRCPAGLYLTKDRAAYWDGKNDQGEGLSSGIYYYQLLETPTSRANSSEITPVQTMILLK